MIKVSVIIPVFCVEEYLQSCLNSIINQTLKEIEIICVNDASPDNSIQIIKEYAQKDKRIKILTHEKNAGLSVARNTGLSYAQGEYVYFMDSDDLVDLDTLSICYEKCKQYSLDIITFDAKVFNDNKICNNDLYKTLNYDRQNIFDVNKIYSGKDFFCFAYNNNSYRSAVWLNFISLDILKSHKLNFYPGIIYEDELFTIQLYFKAKKMMYYPRQFFKRRLRENSIMTKKKDFRNINDILLVSDELFKIHQKEQSKTLKKVLIQKIYSLLKWMEQMNNEITNIPDKEKIELRLKTSKIWGKYNHYKLRNRVNGKIKRTLKSFLNRY